MKIIVVLGHKHATGLIAHRRLNKAASLFKTKKYKYIIITGGHTNPKIYHSEAFLMKQYLIKNHMLPRDKIILENISQNTIENAKYIKKITDNFHRPNITVITSKFHKKRAKKIFNNIYKKNIKFISV